MSTALFDPIKTASRITRRVVVAYSGGKDSAVVLDLCSRYFDEVHVFFMYVVRSLSFQETVIRWVERRYGVTVHRIPHFILSQMLRYGTFREVDLDVPIVSVREIYDYMREVAGAFWIAGGERIKDSIWRRAQLKKVGSVDDKRGRLYPVAHWSKKEILNYVKFRRLKLSPEAKVLGYSFRGLMPREVMAIKKYYPKDYERIRAWFPLVEATVKQYEFGNH